MGENTKNNSGNEPFEIFYNQGTFTTPSNGANKIIPSNVQLSQWNYNTNRMQLSVSIKKSSDLLSSLLQENNSNPINIDLPDLSILNVENNLKLGNNQKKLSSTNDLKLDKIALSKIFNAQSENSKIHLSKLMKRVQDIKSKVLITGDLNSGKSSLCNALLKRNILPTDQLPCTNVFIEVVDSFYNNGLEEVHAVPIDVAENVSDAVKKYNRLNATTFKFFKIEDLERLVFENDKWSLLTVYIHENPASVSTSTADDNNLLHNGIVDISLIDSPGLNVDMVHTSEVFSKQEEIDLVIFVVNAANQLTLSGKDFVSSASREKQFMYFVVTKFGDIKNKERCKQLILDQIKTLSPLTYKEHEKFVHFISNADNGNSPDDNSNNTDNGDDTPNYDQLRESLRNFVLKKRCLSKLLPAKTYLLKLLTDLKKISNHNVYKINLETINLKEKLQELEPKVHAAQEESELLNRQIELLVENTVTEIYDATRDSIATSIDLTKFPRYEGLSGTYDYVLLCRKAIMDNIVHSVANSEEYARSLTENVVTKIYDMGKVEKDKRPIFAKDLMFKQKKHILSKKFTVIFHFGDMFQPSWLGFSKFLQWGGSIQNDGELETQYFTNKNLMSYVKEPSLIFTSKIPTLFMYSFGGAKILTNIFMYGTQIFSLQALKNIGGSLLILGSCLSAAYLVHDLPRALPLNLTKKYKKLLNEIDYAHQNSNRISKVSRQVLKTPSKEVCRILEVKCDDLVEQRKDLESKLNNNLNSFKFFQDFAANTKKNLEDVQSIDLDID
ncbi:related to Transmembrane GTPase FZO1 [Saccharomycodes ludwigii]|uniref:Related to Transmembrane GTPase FZO1 n=1 Tax=Saccharomycodes ludwigii TaxID=36035 RepID=A0A376BC80_9ASCO|nr:hypothetical protein SCDLUD_002044 [Saccharomycodes ludwigii]KAH3902227.1 hypothetical protein SCDLUD_002044 [Saccharomycodes ludwigii]SSD61740.1 related to Transmembrane GTPase FZO1 [Saccharomycodes ludwigii]